MTSVFKPLKSIQSLVLAGVMASAALAATAQTVAPAAPATAAAPAKADGHHGDPMSRHNPAEMQARMARHQAELKARLALTSDQESAWTAYTASMQPSVRSARPTPEQRAEFDKLTTPERIDKMRALRTQRMAERTAAMDKRGDATKSFYAALNADQKKVFDSQRMGRGSMGHGSGHGQPHKG